MKRSNTWFTSILKKLGLRAENPISENPKAENEGQPSNQKTNGAAPVTRTIIDVPDSVIQEYYRNQKEQRRDNRKNRTIAWLAVAGAWIYAAIAAFQWCAMRTANTQNAGNFVASQRPYVSIGTKDGTLGNFSEIANAQGKLTVFLHFHNGGNLPASRFNVQLFAATGPTPESELHMARLKGTKGNSTVMYINGLKEIPRDSDDTESFPNWISQTEVLAARGSKKIIPLIGFFEYCDEFGNYVCRKFLINFDGPTNDFNLLTSSECRYDYPPVMSSFPTEFEYVPPCPSPDEQKEEQAQVKKYIENNRPSPIPAWHAPTVRATPK